MRHCLVAVVLLLGACRSGTKPDVTGETCEQYAQSWHVFGDNHAFAVANPDKVPLPVLEPLHPEHYGWSNAQQLLHRLCLRRWVGNKADQDVAMGRFSALLAELERSLSRQDHAAAQERIRQVVAEVDALRSRK